MPRTDINKQKEYAKKHYKANRQKMIDRAIDRRNEIKLKIKEYKFNNPCSCGESHPAALDFHHDQGEKEFCISNGIKNGYAWDRMEIEIKKCKVMCRNCHSKFHWGNE
jgi:hypothetical protein